MLPVINKIDLPSADADRVEEEIEDHRHRCHARRGAGECKTGEGVAEAAGGADSQDPRAQGRPGGSRAKALIIDSWFHCEANYVGVVLWCAS